MGNEHSSLTDHPIFFLHRTQPCGTGAVDGGNERQENFLKALTTFGLIEKDERGSGPGGGRSSGMYCGADYFEAAATCDAECESNLDCPAGKYCYNDVECESDDR